MRGFAYGVGLAVCLGTAIPANSADKFPVGVWYNETQHGTYRIISLLHIRADGTFDNEFRECHFSPPRVHDESGHWSVSGNNFEMITESVWNRSVWYSGEYKTFSYDGRIWRYYATGGDIIRILGKIRIQELRVTADSKLPGCDLTS